MPLHFHPDLERMHSKIGLIGKWYRRITYEELDMIEAYYGSQFAFYYAFISYISKTMI
jgi:hypothetical protein